jgi:hypothetical protein
MKNANASHAAIILAILARRIDDATRQAAERGVRLSHEEAEEIGEDGLGWCRTRLGLIATTDDAGVMLAPRI